MTISRSRHYNSLVTVRGRYLSLFVTLLVLSLFIAPAQAAIGNDDCLGCHEALKGVSHGNRNCIDCHSAITDLPHADKLPKPVCASCHDRVARTFAGDVHKTKGLECTRCHNAHYIKKEKKECATCHGKVAHTSLPARERHLSSLPCIACHGKPSHAQMLVQVGVKGARAPEASVVGRNGSGLVGGAEWKRFEQLLQGPSKASVTIEKTYRVTGGTHTVMGEPAGCSRCHSAQSIFNDATLRVNDTASYDLRLDPSVFIPSLPAIEEFNKTVHGRNGVTCTDCHGSEKKTDRGWTIDSAVCTKCHEDIEKVYGLSAHAALGAAQCVDCHNPHSLRPYKEKRAAERVAVCARCHTNYLTRHSWLPNTRLHFSYLECAACHSPKSQKSMVYYFAQKSENTKTPLTYDRLITLSGADPFTYLEGREPGTDGYDAGIGRLFATLKQHDANVIIDASIIVTKVYHDYSETRIKEKACVTCHSREARFYDSMFFLVPGKESVRYIPVKGTVFSSYPIGTAVDFFLLGEEKLTSRDFSAFLDFKKGGTPARPLGFKLIDLIAIAVTLLVLAGVCIHVILRIFLVKR